MNDFSPDLKKKIFERDSFRCQKCGYEDTSMDELRIHQLDTTVFHDINNYVTLCVICNNYAPSDSRIRSYIAEKIEGNILDTFRKSLRSISKITKKGMQKQLEQGNIVTRPPFGYKIQDKKLVIDEQASVIVHKIFEEYSQDISLRELARRYNMSAPGITKILKNTAYVGIMTIKDSQISCPIIIKKELWEKIQDKK